MSKYRGDSPGKESARTLAYSRLGYQQFYQKDHIVIAGDLGDVRYLLRNNVNPENIHVCDLNHSRARAARTLDRNIQIYGKDNHNSIVMDNPFWPQRGANIVDVVNHLINMNGQNSIGTVNVDLCLSLKKGLPILKQVMSLINLKKTQVFFTFFSARDRLPKCQHENNPGNRRKNFYSKIMGRPLSNYHSYQSWTKLSIGAPMCTVFCN